MESGHSWPQRISAAERRRSAGPDTAVFWGLCAGAPGADVIGALSADEGGRFWFGYRLVAAICALVLLIELAALATLEVRHDRTGVTLAHGLPAARNGRP